MTLPWETGNSQVYAEGCAGAFGTVSYPHNLAKDMILLSAVASLAAIATAPVIVTNCYLLWQQCKKMDKQLQNSGTLFSHREPDA